MTLFSGVSFIWLAAAGLFEAVGLAAAELEAIELAAIELVAIELAVETSLGEVARAAAEAAVVADVNWLGDGEADFGAALGADKAVLAAWPVVPERVAGESFGALVPTSFIPFIPFARFIAS